MKYIKEGTEFLDQLKDSVHDLYDENKELKKEIERLNKIIEDVLKRQNEALKYIGNFLSMDDRYKHGNGNDQMKILRNILNKHDKELEGDDKE